MKGTSTRDRRRDRALLLAWVVVLVVSLPATPAVARMYEEPKSFSSKDGSQDQVERKVLPKVDVERLLADDRAREKDPRYPHRFAIAVDVAFTLKNSGTWQPRADGRLWRLRIYSPGAKSHNLGITRFDLPEGAKLWIYDPGHRNVEGPYTSKHRSARGSLWTPVITGDEIVVEVFVPANVSEPFVEIGKVNQGYRGFEMSVPGGGTEAACQIDVVCPEGAPWANQRRAVAAYTLAGGTFCTGTLLINTAYDFTKPYVLSAAHCGVNSTNDDSIVVYWNHQAATCGTHGPGPLTDNQTGATFRASWATTDFLLFQLSAEPDPGFGVYYAGWDATGVTPVGAVVGIHHPKGDVKAIALSDDPPAPTAFNSTVPNPSGNYWYAVWSKGIMESGSSGSCLFDASSKRCIGQLQYGFGTCAASPPYNWNGYNWYGRFSVSWNGGGSPATRLKDWLDPGNTGLLAIDGDPHITTANGVHYDFQGAGEFVSIREPDGLEIQTRQAAIATTFNPGPDSYHGIASCVSLNTAVAARVGKHRVTYQPNLTGVPDPSGLQLRVDGMLTTLGPAGYDLEGGGRIVSTAAPGGLEIDFPDRSVLFVTPGWWVSQGKWYLNVSVVRPPATSGASPNALPPGGIAGAIVKGDWLPALPDGTSMGPMPGSVHDRYVDLYRKFGNAWRVTDKSSLFDYAPGTSTDTFTMREWPPEHPPCLIPETKPVTPASQFVAEQACKPVKGPNARKNCVFDVRVTGNVGFARTYLLSERIQAGATMTTVSDDGGPTQVGEPVTFTAIVARTVSNGGGPATGTVQFLLDGAKVGGAVKLDSNGHATWVTSRLKPGRHRVTASYIPSKGSVFLPSTSPEKIHTVQRCPCAPGAGGK